jgi:hypothetical protein
VKCSPYLSSSSCSTALGHTSVEFAPSPHQLVNLNLPQVAGLLQRLPALLVLAPTLLALFAGEIQAVAKANAPSCAQRLHAIVHMQLFIHLALLALDRRPAPPSPPRPPPPPPYIGCTPWSSVLSDFATCTDEMAAFSTRCGDACGVPFDRNAEGTWTINTMNGVGYYQCPCCQGLGRVENGSTEAVQKNGGIDWGALPWWLWMLLVVLPVLLLASGFLIAPKSQAYEMPFSKDPLKCILQMFTGYLHPKMQEAVSNKEVWAGTSLKQHLIKTHVILRYWYANKGDRFVQRGNLFFAACVSIAMGIAFGAVQLTGRNNRSCFETCTTIVGTSSSHICRSTRSSEEIMTGGKVEQPKLLSADTFMSAFFYVCVSQLTTMAMDKFISSCIKRKASLAKPVIFFALGLGVFLVILACVFMASSGDPAEGNLIGLKISLTIAIICQNIVAGWIAYDAFLKPLALYVPARCCLKQYEGQDAKCSIRVALLEVGVEAAPVAPHGMPTVFGLDGKPIYSTQIASLEAAPVVPYGMPTVFGPDGKPI